MWVPGQKHPNATSANGTSANASSNGANGIKLSKSTMSMKFMKDRANNNTNNNNNNNNNNNSQKPLLPSTTQLQLHHHQQQLVFDSTATMTPSSSSPTVYTRETSDRYALLPGRRSFGNFNKAVEKYYNAKLDELHFDMNTSGKSKEAGSGSKADEEEELMKTYENLVALPRGPNQSRKDLLTSQRLQQHPQQPSLKKSRL